MNTKNILKTLALAMLLVSACNKSEIANEENTEKKGFALPVTVNVTREGDDATKATYTDNGDGTGSLGFSTGDKLFVRGNYNSGKKYAGTLDYVSATGKFSGTIYTQNEWENSADALFSSAESIYATLLPAGYDSYNFLSIDNNGTTEVAYDDRESISRANAFVASATAKKTGVEQLSWERAGSYSDGFALAPRYAVLNFTISGLTAGAKDVTLKVTDGNAYSVTGSVTPNALGVATFAIGVLDYTNIQDVANNLTIGSSNFTLPSNIDFYKGKIYNITRAAPVVTNLSTINANYTANDGETLTGTLGADVKISIADGATVTLDGVTINGTHSTSYKWAGITCLGDATIILKDESVNSVVGFCYTYPGIYIPHGKTLTIQGETLGTGVLNATGTNYSAGIGAAMESVDIYRSCGNIVIAGGVINATAGGERAAGIGCGGSTNPGSANPSTCGTITITGGTITATGGKWAPGIGGGFDGDCGDITIANTVTSVTATKGAESYSSVFDCIGRGRDGACGTVKFGNQTMYNGSSWTTTPTSGSTYGGLNLTISQTTYANDTWTLTPVTP
jgi:hypothetical protein